MNLYHKSAEALKAELQEVKAAQANPERFDVLYERYYRQLFLFTIRRTNDEELTADLVSQTFLRALINIKKYQDKGVPFSAWLFRIALNEINTYFRKNNKTRTVSLQITDISSIIDEAGMDSKKEDEQQLMKVLATLPEEAMQMVELRFFEKRSFNEMADILGLTGANAKVKLYRILDKLKKLLIKKK